MAKAFHLQPLFDLAQQRSEDAAQTLQRLKQVWQEAELKRNQLETYLGEYRMRLQENMQGGLTIDQWRDYQSFIAKLETAIETQGEEIERCRLRWEQGQMEWQAREREAKAYDTLRTRHQAQELSKDMRQDQRQQDEFARNQHHRKTYPES
jgi:flagellar FliJ protein